jgi:two-component sensor histidine kinase
LIGWLRLPARAQSQSAELEEFPDSGWSIRLRLLLYVTLALSPIALISIVQGIDRASRDTAEVRERLIQTARAASTSEENILAAAEQIARAMANLPEVRNAEADCRQYLSDALRGVAFFADMARVDAKGQVICSASSRGAGLDLSRQPIWRGIAAGDEFRVAGEPTNRLTSQPAILGMLPIFDSHGRFQGAVAIAIDVHWLDSMLRSSRLPHDSVVAIFGRGGNIIAANHSGVARSVFGHGTDGSDEVRSAPDKNGRTWNYATSALLGKDVFVGFAMRRASLFGPTYVHVTTDFILPFLMIALTWLAIWVVTDRQLARWIVYLRRISAAYRRGHYTVRPNLEGAPKEFRQLGAALAQMASSIEDRDRRLRDALAQKSLLIREIHHRVKNNLQIVMSLLSLQANQLRDPAAKAALKESRARINALALVHRILHELEDQSLVDLKRLLEDLAAQTGEGFGGDRRDLAIETDIVSRHVSSALAVPVALFTVEALTNVFKHAFPPAKRSGGIIRVTLRPAPEGRLRLAIEDNGVGFSADESDTVGTRLIHTFGQQVCGTALIHSQPGKGTVVELWFPDPDLPDSTGEDADAETPVRIAAAGA